MIVDINKIKADLGSVGIYINDIYDLVNTCKSYGEAIPILLNLLKEEIEDVKLREGIIRALAVKEASGLTGSVILEEYNKTPKEQLSLRWAIGNTMYTTIGEKDVESVLQIIQNKENGLSRQMFVAALGRVKSKKVEDVLISLLDDDEVSPHALEALGRLKSIKAIEKISLLTQHPKSLIRKEALKTLKKLNSNQT